MPTSGRAACSSSASSQSPSTISTSSLRNNRNSPSQAAAATLLKRDQLNASGMSTTLSAFCSSQAFHRISVSGMLSMQTIS